MKKQTTAEPAATHDLNTMEATAIATTDTSNITSTGVPVINQAPAAQETAPATSPATATPVPEATATSETTTPATLDDATHAAHRKRFEAHLKEITGISISSGETAPATATPAPAPAETAPTTSEAPATNDTSPATAAEDPTAQTDTSAPPAVGTLPADYLRGGYFKGEGKGRYADPDLVGPTAEELAKALAEGGLKQAGYNPILRELKKANKKTLPLEAKVGALAGAMVKAKLLEQRKRAPHLLVEVLERNRTAVQNTAGPDVYRVAYQHLEAVGAYLGDIQ